MNELLREIEEDIRSERAQKLWHSMGKLMVRLSIAVVVATIVIVLWQNHKQSVAVERTTQFMKGMDRISVGDHKGAIVIFDALADKEDSYAALALLQKAGAEAALGNRDGAHKTYQDLSQRRAKEDSQAFIELARLMAADETGAPILPSHDSPFYYSQSERRAWQLLKNGKRNEAIGEFSALMSDGEAPRSLRARARAAVEYLAPVTDQAKEK